MFGLSQQIRRDEICASSFVGDDHDFGRPRDRIDPNRAKHELLCRGDILVPGPGDLVHARDGFGAKCERGNRLRAPDLINLR